MFSIAVRIKYLLLISWVCPMLLQAQEDSVSIFQRHSWQYDKERELKSALFQNPALMNIYSNHSFSELKIIHLSEDKKNYREPLGAGNVGLHINTQSYKKLNQDNAIWGKAGYKNLNIKKVKWNENLDFEKISPYIIADSLGGNLNYEQYYFSGGYSKAYSKWSWGVEGGYTAQLGYRTKDPRTKNTTSDLSLGLGIAYNIYRDVVLSPFIRINRYTQNSNLHFVSEISEPRVYQMTGFGHSQYLLNYKNAYYEEFSYRLGGQIFNKNKNWYLYTSYHNTNHTKNISTDTSILYKANTASIKDYEIEAAKFIGNEEHRAGLLLNYHQKNYTSQEYGYINRNSQVDVLYRRLSYIKRNKAFHIKGFYQYNAPAFSLSLIPFLGLHREHQQRFYPITGYQMKYYSFGVHLDFRKNITPSQMLSFAPFMYRKNVYSAKNGLLKVSNKYLNDWLIQDYNFIVSNATTLGATIRYDFKLKKLPTLFLETSGQLENIQKKNNIYLNVSVGILF